MMLSAPHLEASLCHCKAISPYGEKCPTLSNFFFYPAIPSIAFRLAHISALLTSNGSTRISSTVTSIYRKNSSFHHSILLKEQFQIISRHTYTQVVNTRRKIKNAGNPCQRSSQEASCQKESHARGNRRNESPQSGIRQTQSSQEGS